MRIPTEAEILQTSAIMVAAPRYMGAFASAIGIDVLAYWPGFAHVEIASGLAMAILEGWSVAFMFRKWGAMQTYTLRWFTLLGLQLALMLTLPATVAPYLASSQLGQPVNALLPFPLWWAWNFTVAAIAPLVLAAVGYSDAERAKEPAIEQVEQTESQQEQPAEPAYEQDEPVTELIICAGCGKVFDKVQGLNAHKRFCAGLRVEVSRNGTGG